MLMQYQEYLTFENIYLWANLGVLPFWILLIFFPNARSTQILVNSIVAPLFLGAAYFYVIYQAILTETSFVDILEIYLSLDNLYTIFATESFLLVFWLHYISINLFVGSWISRNAVRYSMKRSLVFIPLILVYLTGPAGLVMYWMVRIFYAKKLGFHD